MHSDKEVLAFDGTVQGLYDQLGLVLATMPRCRAYVLDAEYELLNGLKITVKPLWDRRLVWDIELFHRKAGPPL